MPFGCQLSDRRRHQRQPDAIGCGLHTVEHLQHRLGRLATALIEIDMRVGDVADHQIRRFHHLLGDVGMQVQRRDHRHVRPDHITHQLEDLTVRIVSVGGAGATMLADIDAIHRAAGFQVRFQLGQKLIEERFLDRTGRARSDDEGRHRLPSGGTAEFLVHDVVEAADPEMDRGVLGPRLAVDIGALEPHVLFEIGTGTARGEAIGFKIESADRDTFLAHDNGSGGDGGSETGWAA